MSQINQKWMQSIIYYKENGVLTLLYNLLIEFLFIGYLGFLSLLSIEMMLPLFITAHISLTKLFIILFLLSFFTLVLGRIVEQDFKIRLQKKNPLVWIGFFFTLCMFLLSTLRFPLSTIPFLLLAFFSILWLLWKIFFCEDQTSF